VFGKKKLPEQLGLHCYAVGTHPDELVLEPPPKKSWIRLWYTGSEHSVNIFTFPSYALFSLHGEKVSRIPARLGKLLNVT